MDFDFDADSRYLQLGLITTTYLVVWYLYMYIEISAAVVLKTFVAPVGKTSWFRDWRSSTRASKKRQSDKSRSQASVRRGEPRRSR